MKKLLIVAALSVTMLSSIRAQMGVRPMDFKHFEKIHKVMSEVQAEQAKIMADKIRNLKQRRIIRKALQKGEEDIKNLIGGLKEFFTGKEFRKKMNVFLTNLYEAIDEQGKMLRSYAKDKKLENQLVKLKDYLSKARKKFEEIKPRLPLKVRAHFENMMNTIREKGVLLQINMMKKAAEAKKAMPMEVKPVAVMEEEVMVVRKPLLISPKKPYRPTIPVDHPSMKR